MGTMKKEEGEVKGGVGGQVHDREQFITIEVNICLQVFSSVRWFLLLKLSIQFWERLSIAGLQVEQPYMGSMGVCLHAAGNLTFS